jgi:hypothetical protein
LCFRDSRRFVESFSTFFDKGREWITRNGYEFDIDFFVWLDYAAQFWGREQFGKHHPQLIEAEERVKELKTEQSEEKWFSVVEPSLPKMTQEFREAIEKELPGLGSRLFVKAFTRWEGIITAACGAAAADEMVPLLMRVRDLSNTNILLTSVGYIMETVCATLDWLDSGHSTGISMGTVQALPGFIHKLTTLTTAAGDCARKLNRHLGVNIDFDFLS